MYVYTWRSTIFFYIYRMTALSFWREEKIWMLYSIVSLLLTPTKKEIIFSFVFFLFTPKIYFKGRCLFIKSHSTFDHAFAFYIHLG